MLMKKLLGLTMVAVVKFTQTTAYQNYGDVCNNKLGCDASKNLVCSGGNQCICGYGWTDLVHDGEHLCVHGPRGTCEKDADCDPMYPTLICINFGTLSNTCGYNYNGYNNPVPSYCDSIAGICY